MGEHDVTYFKDLLLQETESLRTRCAEWREVLHDESIPDDASGEIRTVIGLTELLLNKKFKQFSGLIGDCEHKTSEKEITCQDLQGFWDMMNFEVEKINKGFSDLKKLKNNNFQKEVEISIPLKKLVEKSKKQPLQVVAQPNASTKAHILAARKRLADAKAKAMKNITSNSLKENNESSMVVEFQNIKEYKPPKENTPRKNNKENTPKKSKSDVPIDKRSKTPRDKKPKEFIPLACITRSKSALMKKF